MELKGRHHFTHIENAVEQAHPPVKAVFCDLWGVVHDGHTLFPGAVGALRALQERDITVVFVSNTPLRAKDARAKLVALGMPEDLCKHIVTSGDAAYDHFVRKQEPQHYYYMGPDALDVLQTLPQYTRTDDPAKAAFVLASAFTDSHPDLNAVEPALQACAKAKLPMVCLNADSYTVRSDGSRERQGGQIGLRYGQIRKDAGAVRFFGKPMPEVYALARQKLHHHILSTNILAVGDSTTHDIAGGNYQRYRTLLVTHTGLMGKSLEGVEDVSKQCMEHSAAEAEAFKRCGMKFDPVPHFTIPAFAAKERAADAGAELPRPGFRRNS